MSVNEEFTNEEFSNALMHLKTKKGWSYTQISLKTGLSAPYLNDLVNKKKLPPTDENIIKIARAFGLPPEYFREYRNRRLSESMQENLDFHLDNYDVPLSPEEIEYLKKIIEKAEKE